jgi:hypothetical protein
MGEPPGGGGALNVAQTLDGLTGQRLIDATPTVDVYRDTTCDEFDGVADRLEEAVDASVRQTLTTTFLAGPRTLYRFCDGGDAEAVIAGRGSWWTHESPVAQGINAGRGVPEEQRAPSFRNAMRNRLAVKVDWNKMSSIRTLRIPGDVAIRVMTALAAPQSDRNGTRHAGGGIQYILVLSELFASGIYPSEPEPLVRFLARRV